MKLVATIFAVVVIAIECCKDVNPRRAFLYKRLKKDAQSMESVLLRRRLASVDKCKDLAESKGALAFNFARLPSNNGDETANCALLQCPETSGLRQLTNVTGVDYYSAYSRHLYTGNDTLTCVRNVGLFVVRFQKQNFSNARKECQKHGAFLADVVGEDRTNGLAKLIGESEVFVGLGSEGKQRTWKNELGESLACQEFRAWAAGEPSRSRGCVALRSRSDASKSQQQQQQQQQPTWKVVSCALELAFVCEVPRLSDRAYLNRTADA